MPNKSVTGSTTSYACYPPRKQVFFSLMLLERHTLAKPTPQPAQRGAVESLAGRRAFLHEMSKWMPVGINVMLDAYKLFTEP
nr:MAG TPA_asm: hypothetical protein [Caudoviricetes sp.]